MNIFLFSTWYVSYKTLRIPLRSFRLTDENVSQLCLIEACLPCWPNMRRTYRHSFISERFISYPHHQLVLITQSAFYMEKRKSAFCDLTAIRPTRWPDLFTLDHIWCIQHDFPCEVTCPGIARAKGLWRTGRAPKSFSDNGARLKGSRRDSGYF